MTDIAERISRLNQRASEAVEKAKSGRTRIKGDGDGDGIPYEGRGKKGGAGGGGANPFAQRHLGVTNGQYTREDGSKVSYQITPNTIARNLPKYGGPVALSDHPWKFIGQKDRGTIEHIVAQKTPFKDGFKVFNDGSKDFRMTSKSDFQAVIQAAYKAGGGKGQIDAAVADKIAARFTPFKTLTDEKSDRLDFSDETPAFVFRDAASAALLYGKFGKL